MSPCEEPVEVVEGGIESIVRVRCDGDDCVLGEALRPDDIRQMVDIADRSSVKQAAMTSGPKKSPFPLSSIPACGWNISGFSISANWFS